MSTAIRRAGRSLTALLAVVSLLLAAAGAEAATPVPPFPESGVAVAGVSDDYDPVRAFLARFESGVGAQYHIAVVDLSDPRDRRGPEFGDDSGAYIDAVVDAWRPHLDPRRHVTIVLALGNREVLIQPGSDWVMLGYAGDDVSAVTDRSSFPSFARAGNYRQALIQLVQAIDGDLVRRRDEAEAMRPRVEARLEDLPGTLEAVRQLLAGADFQAPGTEHLLTSASDRLEQAESALTSGDVMAADRLSRDARSAADQAERAYHELVASRAATAARLETLDGAVAELDQRVREAGFEATETRAYLEEARHALTRGREALAQGDLEAAVRFSSDSVSGVQAADRAYFDERASHKFWTRTLPIDVALTLFALLAVLVLFLRQRQRIWRIRGAAEVASWTASLDLASQRLLSLESEHATLLGQQDLATRFAGETEQAARAAAERLDDLFLSYEAAQRLLQRARDAIDSAGLFGTRGFADALQTLESGEVVVRTEEVVERRLFLPFEREVKRSASNLVSEMDAQYAGLTGDLEALEGRLGAAWEALDRTTRALAGAEEALAGLDAQALSLTVWQERLEALAGQVQAASSAVRADPLGEGASLDRLEAHLGELTERLGDIAAALTLRAEVVAPALEKTTARVRQLRESEGMRLLEPGFEPDRMLEHGAESARQALAALEAGAAPEGRELMEEARSILTELAELAEASVRSRAESKEAINALMSRSRALRERVPEARARLGRLATEHAKAALQPALDNAEEADAALDYAASCLREATTAVTVSEQRYLAGAELVSRATRKLDGVQTLFDEIETVESELLARRSAAEASLAALAGHLDELSGARTDGAAHLSAASLELNDTLCERRDRLTEQSAAALPNWIAVAAEAEVAERVSAELVDRVAAEKAAYEAAVALFPSVEAKRDGLRALLASSEEDRPPANETLQAGSDALDALAAGRTEAHPDWPALLEALRSADGQLDEAKRLAEADFTRAEEVRQQIARANEAVIEASTSYGHGVTAQLGQSQAALAEARSLLVALDYEQALKRAATSFNEARAAARTARERASELATRAMQRAASWSWSSGSSSSSRSSRSSGWSSHRSSSSSWSSSRSSGRSSSSSSSFGSSSGRSSFGRSSGRSKW